MQFIAPLLISFFSGVLILRFLVPFLRKEKMDQTEREELASHQKKNGTPTMGGIAIILSFIIGNLLYVTKEPGVLPVLILTVGFGFIGFLDDYLKVIKKHPDGLIAWQKFLLQIMFTAIFYITIVKRNHISLDLRIPFTNGEMVNIGWLAIVLMFIAVIGTVNGTNFTDGLDGLATSVTVPVAIFFTFASVILGKGSAVTGMAMIGALLAFLLFNCYPAQIFMGDTGSLALGGFVAGMAYLLNMPLYIVIVGFIYLLEVVSVIIQVLYFKATGGKRIFRMAPIHHHYELGGWSETKVCVTFTVITIMLCVIAAVGI
ncbi:MAG: phospho-N-acetylmuramoyl-pentapeptide-transferase [Lachnospiraceae bacterium]|nr:phospho-N-acetylmuramoyl-pentapeptide-transferase [Lachnospiraceae bacterium]